MEDLQSILEKINRDGVEKADAEAKRIVDAAKAEAARIVAEAKAEADRAKADAEKSAADYAARSAETIRQAARDIVLGVKGSVTALLERLLAADVDAALSDEPTAAEIVREAVKGLAGPGEVVCGGKLAKSLAAQLASLGPFTVVADEAAGSGFTVRLEGGRVEHTFTGEAIAGELAKRLRPDLAALIK